MSLGRYRCVLVGTGVLAAVAEFRKFVGEQFLIQLFLETPRFIELHSLQVLLIRLAVDGYQQGFQYGRDHLQRILFLLFQNLERSADVDFFLGQIRAEGKGFKQAALLVRGEPCGNYLDAVRPAGGRNRVVAGDFTVLAGGIEEFLLEAGIGDLQ